MALRGVRFVVPKTGNKKYTAILPSGKRVSFGDRRYQHYKDSVPKRLGGGKWSRLDHMDTDRRNRYRKRHSKVMSGNKVAKNIKYTPAWFSWHYLW